MKADWAVSIALCAPLLLVALLLHWLPLWRRSSLWFAVTVAPDFGNTPPARQVLRGYRIAVWTVSTAALIVVWLGLRWDATWMLLAGQSLQVLGAAAAFAHGRNRIRPSAQYPDGTRAAPLSTVPEGMPGGLAAVLGPYGLLAAAAIFLDLNWQRIPARFPVHWGISGMPDRYAQRTWQSVDGVLVAGGLLLLALHGLGYLMQRGSPRARIPETADWTARFRRANLRMIVAMGWTMSLLFSALALNPYFAAGDRLAIPVWPIVGVVLAVTAAFLWPIVRISQEPGSGSDGTPDECWKLGQIYYNPNDPALMVEKRFGVGYTINFGNRASWLLAAVLLLLIFVPLLL